MTAKPGKILLCISTSNRPRELTQTIHSVLEQATRFGHHVETVVSDLSTDQALRRENRSRLDELREQFRLPIHYYGPGVSKPIREALARAEPEEIAAYHALVPADGHWGAFRNRLTLLAAHHAESPDVAFLQLDDDRPLARLNNGELEPHEQDVLARIVQRLEEAKRRGRKGANLSHTGLPVLTTSRQDEELQKEIDRLSLNELLRKPSMKKIRLAPACKVIGMDALEIPYSPYGLAEEVLHEEHCGGFFEHPQDHREALFVHIGKTPSGKVAESPGYARDRFTNVPKQLRLGWAQLIGHMQQSAPPRPRSTSRAIKGR